MVEAVSLALLLTAFVACLTFVILYQAIADWRSSSEGRHLIVFQAAIGIILLGAILRRIFGDHPVFQTVTIGTFAAFTGLLWWRVVMLWRAQHPKNGAGV